MQQEAYPFVPLPGEEAFHLYNNISVKMQGQQDTELSFEPLSGSILVTNLRLAWFSQPRDLSAAEQLKVEEATKKHGEQKNHLTVLNHNVGKSFMFKYEDLVSHGLQGGKLVCFLGSNDESEIEVEDQPTLNELASQTDPSDIINIEGGQYQIEFDLQQLNKTDQEDLFERFSELATANVELDDDDSQDDMITAEQIDEDGNIYVPKQEENEEDWSDDS